MTIASLLLLTVFAVPSPGGGRQALAEPTAQVVGRVELTPAAADAAARDSAEQEIRWDLERRASLVVDAARPFWLPAFAGELISSRWKRQISLDRVFRIADGERRENDHGTYKSYQTALRVVLQEAEIERSMRDLRRELERGSRRFAVISGGTAGLWALLALVYGWLDRVTRGYMPWRLRLVCGGMGIAAPGIALLFL